MFLLRSTSCKYLYQQLAGFLKNISGDHSFVKVTCETSIKLELEQVVHLFYVEAAHARLNVDVNLLDTE